MSRIDISAGSPFPAAALPYGIGAPPGGPPRPVVAVGDHALDLMVLERAGSFHGTGLAPDSFRDRTLNRFVEQGRPVWFAVRQRLRELIEDVDALDRLGPDPVLLARDSLLMDVPVEVGDYVDFYSCIHHATNLGRLFRPDSEPLLANWRRLPVGYHGRSGTIVADGATISRPSGLRLVDGTPQFGPCDALDIELEVGFVVGPGNERGRPIAVDEAAEHIFGICLVNDWSARDLQAFEYVPLGPFLGKSFATSMGPWVLPLDALDPFRTRSPEQDPPVADYLRSTQEWGFDLQFEVALQTSDMRASGREPAVISRTGFDMYWTPAQQLAHLTVNGASTRPGDLFASGTISGPEPGSEGSLIEMTRNGEQPITLPDGSVRAFLLDGDTITIRGWAGRGPGRIGLGSLTGTIAPPPRRQPHSVDGTGTEPRRGAV